MSITLGQVPSQMKGNKWYERAKQNRNIMTLEMMLDLPKAKTISYFKVQFGSHGGMRDEIQYWKTMSNGFMIFVDCCNMKIGIVQGFKQNCAILPSTKKSTIAILKNY